jgi:hypothetical protein
VAEDFHVLAAAGAVRAGFDPTTQAVQAALLDAGGRHVRLLHPYTARGHDGAEALLAGLTGRPQDLRFVSGPVRRSATGLVIHPVCLVWQDGAGRTALQPWIDRRPAEAGDGPAPPPEAHPADPVGEYLRRLQEELGELLVLGLRRADARVARRWQELGQQGEAVGLVRVAGRVAVLGAALGSKSHTLSWDAQSAGRALLELTVLVQMAQDLAS